MAGEGFTITATRSSLEDFQQKVFALKAVAAEQRNKIAIMEANVAEARYQADIQRNLAAQAKQVTDRVADMRSVTAQLSDAINQSPNFAQAAAVNTAKIARMASTAPTLAFVARGQLGVAANQIAVNTNQIEVQRTQYANNLNGLVADIASDASQIDRICGRAPALPLVAPCESAKLATRAYKTVYERGRLRFTPYKAQVEAELAKQERLLVRFDN